MNAKLLTRSREFVTAFLLPPFQLLPEVAIWGTRIFVLEKPFEQKFGQPADPIYIEACPWSVDASKAMWSEHMPNSPTE